MSERSYVLSDDLGVIETVHQDSSGRLTIARKQDVSRILDANKAQSNDAPGRFKDEMLNHVARIPMVVYEQWLKELPKDADEATKKRHIRAKLNDPDTAFLRTRKGRI